MVTTPAKGNVVALVAAVADDIRGRGSEVAKEREIETEREDRREKEAMGRGRRFRRRCNSQWLPFLRRNSTVVVDGGAVADADSSVVVDGLRRR
ncbi:hypothetical protein PIB30_046552 [Stylosanthes scabra]|uniref:Uncharacterized protein n=1 Tax=Stylosanthes scabra TaxID=79078 RepID=A0ABU6UF46_9FABA|nr:hypothetical protein [Stylosanthes scabra]